MMSFVIAYILPIVSTAIAVVSIVLSVKAYRRDTPKLQIDIENPKYDCFFGDVSTENEQNHIHKNRISGIRFTLRNNSAANIEVNGIALKIRSEMFQIISPNNPFWDTVNFFTYDADEQKMIPDYLYAISYSNEGFSLPLVINSYTSSSGCALFYNFPASITGRTTATLYVRTAIGVCKKKVRLLQYDNTFQREELEDVEQHQRSLR